MKLVVIYLVFLVACALATSPVPPNSNWRLAWSDEFNTLDTTKWNIRNKAGNYGNKELQWYAPSQVSVANGNLVITAIKQAFGGESYMSGWIDSQDKAYFTYGRYEVRAKMAGGMGIWPAMWLLSQNRCWAYGAEVDIAEFRGAYPKNIGTYYHYASKCCTSFTNCVSSEGSEHTTSSDLTADFHTYALEWYPQNMTWFVDGVKVDSYLTTAISVTQDATPHYWVINNAIGGSYPGNPNASTVFPNYHYVDYVAYYVNRASCSGVTCSGKGCCNATTAACVCNAGYAGLNCEQNIGTSNVTFTALTSLDNVPNGWGNPYTEYLTANTVASKTGTKFTLTNSGCPSSCGGVPYSSGAWESIPRYSYGTFTFSAKAAKLAGSGFSLSATDETNEEAFEFTILGGNTTFVELWTTSGGYPYMQTAIKLGFDASSGYNKYGVVWSASSIMWYVNGAKVWETDYALNAVRLGPGAYFTADQDWYGALSYTSPTSAYINNFNWVATPSVATC